MTDPRIIYVTGMKPKPPPEPHRRALLRMLIFGLSRVRPEAAAYLTQRDSVFRLVSWTHLFYGSRCEIAPDLPGIERLLAAPEPTPREIAAIDSPIRRLARLWHLFGDSAPWTSRLVARGDLKGTLAEVQQYLLNRDGVADRVRDLVTDALVDAWSRGERVLLIGHSLGSVIAYECLWRASLDQDGGRRVELFVTLGSPLATRFIRLGVEGSDHRGRLRFPGCVDQWQNFSARGELTALHPRLAPFIVAEAGRQRPAAVVDHADIYNHFRDGGRINVHKSYGYLINAEFAGAVGDWLLAGR